MEDNDYNIVVVFGIHRHESTVGTHVSPVLNRRSPVSPHSIPLGCPRASALSALLQALNLHRSSILHVVIYIFQCCSLKSSHPHLLPQEFKSLFFTSVSLLLLSIDCRYSPSRFHIYALIYSIGVLFLTYFTLYNRLQFHPTH